VRWIEGDAEALPFEAESFDVVISTFGVMFAPRHGVAAAEMVRVLRPGGRIGLATWTPEGSVGRLFRAVGAHLPPPPEIASPPIGWGVEAHVEELFDGQSIEVSFERRRLALNPDIDHAKAVPFYLASFGPLVRARAVLEPQGRWQAAEAQIRPAIENMLADPPEYLVTTGTKRG
jgi:SAM-dependent methyltransferase